MISLSVLKALNVIQMTGTKTSKAIMINIKATGTLKNTFPILIVFFFFIPLVLLYHSSIHQDSNEHNNNEKYYRHCRCISHA